MVFGRQKPEITGDNGIDVCKKDLIVKLNRYSCRSHGKRI